VLSDQQLQGARGAARTYMDPLVSQARGQQVAEQEQLLDARYGKEAELQQKAEAARVAADAKIRAAELAAGGGLQRSAIAGLLKSRELRTLMTGKGDPSDAQIDALLNSYARGQGPEDASAPAVDDASLEALIAGAKASQQGFQQLKGMLNQLTPEQKARVRQVFPQ
jgi:hypothetical protein